MRINSLPSLAARIAALLLGAAAVAVLPAADTVTLPVYAGGPDSQPIVFEASRSDLLQVAEGYYVQGDVQLVFGEAKLPLLAANLFFQFAEGSDRIERVRGTTYVPSPYVGDNVVIKKPAMAEFGMDYGANLDLGVPLNAERSYLFFRFDAGFEMEVGFTGDAEDTKPLTFEFPAGAKAMLILDPNDPFFFFSGEMLTPDGDKGDKDGSDGKTADNSDSGATDSSNANADGSSAATESGDSNEGGAETANDSNGSNDGQQANNEGEQTADDEEKSADDLVTEPGFGASYQSLIPFRPQNTYGLEDVVREFQGDTIVTGEVQLGELPLVVKGQIIIGHGLTEDAGLLERVLLPPTQTGANGAMDFGYEFLKVSKLGNIAEISIPLGTATAAYEIVDGLQYAYITGKIDPDTSWIPDWVPVKPEYEQKAYGYVSSDIASSRIAVESLYAVDMSSFGDLAGVDLGRVISVEGAMKINQDGFLVAGSTDADLGPFAFEAGARAEVFFPFDDPQLAYAVISGRLRVGGATTEGVLRISNVGVTLNGRLVNDQFDLRGQLDLGSENGVQYLAGRFDVPQEFNQILTDKIASEVEAQRQQTQSLLDAYQKATQDYEFEVSLRGVRKVIPGVCDSAISGIDSGINAAFKKWPKKWGVSRPRQVFRPEVGAKTGGIDQESPAGIEVGGPTERQRNLARRAQVRHQRPAQPSKSEDQGQRPRDDLQQRHRELEPGVQAADRPGGDRHAA